MARSHSTIARSVRARREGYALNEDGTIHCYRCHSDAVLACVRLVSLTGAADAAHAVVECPCCNAIGVLLLDRGPGASRDEIDALETLEMLETRSTC